MRLLLEAYKRFNNMDMTAITIAVMSLIGTIIAGLIQFRKLKAEDKNTDALSASSLVKLALELNKQEIVTLREVNTDLANELDLKQKVIDSLRKELDEVHYKMAENRKELDEYREDVKILKLSLEAVQCELDVQKEMVKKLQNGEK